jgi:glycine cleavage system transcriptional repressor
MSTEPGRQWFAIAAIGRDRPGIVADLSECVYACGCNLEDASMTMLGSEFATLMLVSGIGKDLSDRLAEATKRLEWERRLTIFVRKLEAEPAPPAGHDAACWNLTAEGIDKAGIVAGVSRCLADHGVLIADLRSGVTPIPQSGTPLYTLRLRMLLPPTLDPAALRSGLAGVGHRLEIDIRLEPAD